MGLDSIERSILSSFLFANDLGDDLRDVYPLDLRAFTSPMRKRIAERINEVTDGSYGYLSYKIEESIKGTAHEMEWIEILAQTPLTLRMSKRYHDDILRKSIVKGKLL